MRGQKKLTLHSISKFYEVSTFFCPCVYIECIKGFIREGIEASFHAWSGKKGEENSLMKIYYYLLIFIYYFH